MKEKEIRNYQLELKAIGDGRSVEGYAAVFDSESQDLGGFTEIISRDAFNNIIEESDVMALLNHDMSRGILARSRYGKGTLELSIDEHGLRYKFEAPHTSLGDETLEYLRRGDITSSSFAFCVGKDAWEKRDNGKYLRRILKVDRLFDVSPVYEPAYLATSVSCRSFEEAKKELEKREEPQPVVEEPKVEEPKVEEPQPEPKEDLVNYFKDLREEYLK